MILPPFDEALASGNLVKNTGTVIGSFVLAVTVKEGSPLPDLSTTDSVQKSVALGDASGHNGIHYG